MNNYPFQPPGLVGNPFSDAYFGALSRQRATKVATCAHCSRELRDRRMTDGYLSWCDGGHRDLWARKQQEGSMQRYLAERGVNVEQKE